MPQTKYLSDSNTVWPEGDPREKLRQADWPRVHVLIHPVWWACARRVTPTQALYSAVDCRVAELDAYLRRSNDVWQGERSGGGSSINRP